MKDWIFIVVFALMVALFTASTYREQAKFETWVIRVSDAMEERDTRQFKMNQRLQTLEEQRGLEQRLTSLEKSIRTFCVGNKIEMCGMLEALK